MLIEERYKDEDTGSEEVNSLPKLELSYSAGVCFFLIKASKKDNYQLENKEIKNLPPNLKKNLNLLNETSIHKNHLPQTA